jgi:bile acid:Na+ symporter, BASS family
MGIQLFSSIILPAVLALIMLGMGAELSSSDFRNIRLEPKGLFLGLIAQMLLLPALAILIAFVFPMSPAAQAGLLILAACPGGTSSNLLSNILKGNVALSVSFTIVNTLLSIITIPIFVMLAFRLFFQLDFAIDFSVWKLIAEIFVITVVPVAIGLAIHAKWPIAAKKIRDAIRRISPLLLAIAMVGAIFFDQKDNPIEFSEVLELFPATMTLNVLGMAIGYLLAAWLRLKKTTRLTIGLEVGLQNSGLAIAIITGVNALNMNALVGPASAYALFSFFTAVTFGIVVNGQNLDLWEVIGLKKEDQR